MIQYKKGYHYQLVTGIRVSMPHAPDVNDSRCPFVSIEFVSIERSIMWIKPGYAWDGASGAIDTESFMVGSCVHDAICQLTDLDLLPYGPWREWGDRELVRICRANGMNRIRAWFVLRAVRMFSKRNRKRRAAEKIYTASAEGVGVYKGASVEYKGVVGRFESSRVD